MFEGWPWPELEEDFRELLRALAAGAQPSAEPIKSGVVPYVSEPQPDFDAMARLVGQGAQEHQNRVKSE